MVVFVGSFRLQVLDAYLFTNLAQVRQLAQEWLQIYNAERPHQALNTQRFQRRILTLPSVGTFLGEAYSALFYFRKIPK